MPRKKEIKKGRPKGAQSLVIRTERNTYSKPLLSHGRWRVRVKNRRTGKLKTWTLEAETFEDARLEVMQMATVEAELDSDVLDVDSPRDLTITKVFARWLKTVDARPVTVTGYKQDLDLIARELGEDRTIDGVNLADLEELFHDTWKEQSGRSKIKKRALMKRVWTWASKHKLVDENVPENLEIPKKWRDEDSNAKETTGFAIIEDDARKLLDACADDQDLWLAVLIAARTGLRMSNIIGYRSAHRGGNGEQWKRPLVWRDIDLDERVLTIPEEQSKNKLKLELPIHAELAYYLARRRDSKKRIRLDAPIVELTKWRLVERFQKRVEKLELVHEGSWFTFHCLRKSFTAWLEVDYETPRPIVSKLLGHKKGGDVTARYSAARRKDKLERAREYLERLEWLTPKPVAKVKSS